MMDRGGVQDTASDQLSVTGLDTVEGMYRTVLHHSSSQPVWGEVAMVRWGKRDWLDVVVKIRGLDSSFSDVDNACWVISQKSHGECTAAPLFVMLTYCMCLISVVSNLGHPFEKKTCQPISFIVLAENCIKMK